jgi:hypothetical protein
MNELAIWWVTPGNEMYLQRRVPEIEALPRYICVEVRDLFGRSMRGRLWISREITPKINGINWDDTKPLASLASKSGGIVIYRKDIDALRNMPGFITDLEMNEICQLSPTVPCQFD